LKDVVKITTSAKTPDPDQLRRINEVVDRLVKEHSYCPVCANELLTYVGTRCFAIILATDLTIDDGLIGFLPC
jgi:predicted Ser/Thr protein kinase